MEKVSIFKDESLAVEFDTNGYVILDLLDEKAIVDLKNIYDDAKISFGGTFYSSSFISDKEKKKVLSEKLESVIDPYIFKHFTAFRKLGASILIKPPGPDTIMPIHQDWTVVDEKSFSSVTAWIPLQDTNENNGAIKVLPGSHMLTDALRAPTGPDTLSDIRSDAEQLMRTLPLKMGQAFVFNHAVLHSSSANNSDIPRVAVAYGILHKDADLIYYYHSSGSDEIEVLSIPDDFFLNYPQPGERPEGSKKTGSVPYKEHTLDKMSFKNFYTPSTNRPKHWLQKGLVSIRSLLFKVLKQ